MLLGAPGSGGLKRTMRERLPVVVFGGGINALGVIRNLGREGVDVYCVLESPDPIIYSKYCKEYFILSHFTHDLIMSFLSKFARRVSGRQVIISTDDTTTLILSRLRDQMEDRYTFLVPSKEIAETLIVKSEFYRSLVKNKIEHPQVMIPSACSDVKEVGRKLGYPVFVRPCMSQLFAETFGKKGFVANSESELCHYYQLAAKYNLDVVFQEIVPGPAPNQFGIAGCFGKSGRPLGLFGYHRLRQWPLMFGNSSLMESVSISSLSCFKEIVTAYLGKIGYYGVMDAEFKLDPRNGICKLLEINARSWWQNSFPTRCGLNVILKAYLDAIGEEVTYSEEYAAGLKWIRFRNDVSASIAGGEIMRASWFNSFANVRDYSLYDAHDLAPSTADAVLLLRARLFPRHS